MPEKIAIIGGGITGLAAAYRLLRLSEQQNVPIELTLLEQSARLGGNLHSTSRDGFLFEGGPDCWISNKPQGVRLCEELGIAGELINTRPEFRRSFIVRGAALHPVPEGFYLLAPARLKPFLASPLLSWKGKLRAICEPLIPARPQDEESLSSFVRRRMGQEVLDWLAQPLLAGIYAADPELLSLRATFPQFLDMEKRYGSILLGLSKRDRSTQSASGARYSLFVSLRNGMETLARKLSEPLRQSSIRLECRVSHLQRSANGWTLLLEDGTSLDAHAVCVCTGAQTTALLLERQDRRLAMELAEIPCTTSITVNMAFDERAIRHPMDGVGFVTPQKEADPAIACTFAHRKFDGRAPKGMALLRAFLGGAHHEAFLQRSDDDLVQVVLEQITPLLGISASPQLTSVARWPKAMPQYTLGHLKRCLAIEESVLALPGLVLAGNWQYGVGIPDCIESGERAANQLIDYLRKRRE